MKFIIAIIISIVLSVVFLGVLAISGIVNIGKIENSPDLTITLPIPEKNNHTAENKLLTDTNTETDSPETEKTSINTTALKFFDNLQVKENEDIEEQFTLFLTQEHHADSTTIDVMIKKCFWKNFHTLQTPLKDFNSLESFKTAYLMEKKLKTAGFHAMGLTLNKDQLIKTDSRFKLLQGKMDMIKKERRVL